MYCNLNTCIFLGKVSGISNLGYTCFLNSLLQALAACSTFTAWLKEQGKKKKSSSFISNLISVIDSKFINLFFKLINV